MLGPYEYWINSVAGGFLVLAQGIYILQVIKKQITPSLFTWLGWFILVGVSLWSQWITFGWQWILVGHLFSALGCFGIFVSALLTRNFQVRKQDYTYLIVGMGCVLLYVLFKDPWITTIFAIAADLILGIPTILKGIHAPRTEKTIGWNIALGCWSLTLATSVDKNAIYVLFPLYCLLFNLTMTWLTTNRRIRNREGKRLLKTEVN